jgi:aspartate aminotransferase-like enzyme
MISGRLFLCRPVFDIASGPLRARGGGRQCHRALLEEFSIEIGAGLGPLAGRIWRVGLMGAGSTLSNVLLFLTALERVWSSMGHRMASPSAAVTAAESAATR